MAAIDILGSVLTVLSVAIPVISAISIATIGVFMAYAVYDLARDWIGSKALVRQAALHSTTKVA